MYFHHDVLYHLKGGGFIEDSLKEIRRKDGMKNRKPNGFSKNSEFDGILLKRKREWKSWQRVLYQWKIYIVSLRRKLWSDINSFNSFYFHQYSQAQIKRKLLSTWQNLLTSLNVKEYFDFNVYLKYFWCIQGKRIVMKDLWEFLTIS